MMKYLAVLKLKTPLKEGDILTTNEVLDGQSVRFPRALEHEKRLIGYKRRGEKYPSAYIFTPEAEQNHPFEILRIYQLEQNTHGLGNLYWLFLSVAGVLSGIFCSFLLFYSFRHLFRL